MLLTHDTAEFMTRLDYRNEGEVPHLEKPVQTLLKHLFMLGHELGPG